MEAAVNGYFPHLRSLLQSSKKVIPLRKHSFLFQEGIPANELYLILSGKVQVSKICPDGKEMCFRICGSGEIVGELTLFTNDARYLLTAKVIEARRSGSHKQRGTGTAAADQSAPYP